MKTVTIPTSMSPFVVTINNHTYSYPAGETVEVPDEVAEAIMNAIDTQMEVSKPDGNGGKSVDVVWTLAEGGGISSMTFDEIIEASGSRGAEAINIVIMSEVSGRTSKISPVHVSVSKTEIYVIAFEGSSSALKRWLGRINSTGGKNVQWSGNTVTIS